MSIRSDLARNALLTVLVAFSALSIDIVLPVLGALATAFRATPADAQLALSAFVLGFAAAQLVAGPLSDRYGRRPVLIGGCALYVAASIGCIFAASIEHLVAARFVQALGACAGPVLARAVVRDVYGPQRATKVLAYMASVMAVVPAAAPLFGGLLVDLFGWRAVFVALAVFGTVALAGCLFMLEETNRWRDPLAMQPRRLAANYGSLLRDRTYLGYLVAASTSYTGLFCFHSLSGFILIDGLRVPAAEFGYWFLILVVGYLTGNMLVTRITGRFRPDTLVTAGLCCQVAAGLLHLALGYEGLTTPLRVVAPMGLYMFGAGLLFPNATVGAIGPHPTKAGAASAVFGFAQFTLGALVGMLAVRLFTGHPIVLSFGVLIAATTGLVTFRLLMRGRTGPAAAPASAPAE